MKTHFILNPHSGRNRRRPWLAGAIRDFISGERLDAGLAVTEGPGHATELARAAVREGADCVVAVGGDGTVNEVAQALIGAPTALALVPCGSGNGLALHLKLPQTLRGALELLRSDSRRIEQVDTGLVNGRPFFNAMGLGLDADVSRRFNRLQSRGLPAYCRTALAVLRDLRSERVTILQGDRSETIETILVAVTNSDQYGNHARIAPSARVDDGLLDVVAIEPVGLLRATALSARLFLGTLDRSPRVRRWRGSDFVIERSAPGLIHTDGETHALSPRLEIEVKPKSLRVLLPATSNAVGSPAAAAARGFRFQLP